MENKIAELIKAKFNALSKSEKKVATFLLNYTDQMEELTTNKIAKLAKVSEPTIIRFSRSIGFKNFKALKVAFIEVKVKSEMHDTTGCCDYFYGYQISKTDAIEDVPNNITAAISSQLEHTLKDFDIKLLEKAVELITTSRKILIVGVESSATAAHDLNMKLTYLGFRTIYCEDQYLKYMHAAQLTEKDLIIGISYSGYAEETLDVLHVAKKCGAKSIGITNFGNSMMREYVDDCIELSSTQFLYGNLVFSRTIQLALNDIIYVSILLTDYDYYTQKIDKICDIITNTVY